MRSRIVIGSAHLAGYPEGGGHFLAYVQFLPGLKALGHDVHWLEVLYAGQGPIDAQQRAGLFMRRMRRLGLAEHVHLLIHDTARGEAPPRLETLTPVNTTRREVTRLAETADLFWNLTGAIRRDLSGLFRRRVLIDTDPGKYQLGGLEGDMGLDDHEVLFTVGGKMHDPDCRVPTLGHKWNRFRPILYLPWWPVAPEPAAEAPWSSVTQWPWGKEYWYEGERIVGSKREGYLAHIELPKLTGRRLQLAANIHPGDRTGDRERLQEHGWSVVHPHRVAGNPWAYARYIRRSRGEILVPQPIYRAMRTGWFSDRSVCYLASGRPVVAGDTGFSDYLPTGAGLIGFNSVEQAAEGIRQIEGDYATHARAARELAEAELDGTRTLAAMLDAC